MSKSSIKAHSDLLRETASDLRKDFHELEFLYQSTLTNINNFRYRFLKNKKFLQPVTRNTVSQELARVEKIFLNFRSDIEKSADELSKSQNDLQELIKFIGIKNIFYDLYRTNLGIAAALITSCDWQSPSFDFSLTTQAGMQTGKVEATFNDYKRDHHLDQKPFEEMFIKEYVEVKNKKVWNALLTNSGQAAFTTILNFLAMEGKLQKKVLLGKSSYFQYKNLVVKLLRSKVIETDETETDKIISCIKRHQPEVIFLDSLCNSKSITIPNLTKVIDFLANEYRHEVYLVIDNTGLSISFSCWDKLSKNTLLKPIIFESLIKYLQFGLDRVNGGVIIAPSRIASKIFEYRKNLGTNIADFSVYLLPRPNNKMLNTRLKRFERNAKLLSLYLQELLVHNKTNMERVVYPGLSDHQSSNWTKNWWFHGCFFNLKFKPEFETTSFYKNFIRLVIAHARKNKIELIGGTSFGLNQTRIYLTSLWTDFGDPFLRIAVGSETRLEMESVKRVLADSILEFDSKIPKGILTEIKKMKKRLHLDRVI
ncbi:PLP-dependent transferase [Candidatus Gottesmanbacteria bacterium]|nr:PLP-dependent transferase [Candidatus Gottesmanbacteria bacterium]